ncbi:MAG TPA: CHASE2 domain-containing protein [Chitinophagaceae bacterium]|jgi:hypothetical protein|nr:CHASE2 domain-containing protein [Chitinophagaceae bacterium]
MANKATRRVKPSRFPLFKSKRFLRIVLPLAILFTLLNLIAIHCPLIEPEQKIIVKSTNVKKWLDRIFKDVPHGPDFLKKNFLLINVTRDMTVSCKEPNPDFYADSTRPNPYPCTPIVDRSRLISLLTWLNEHPDRFEIVVCDLLFEKTKNDSLDSELVNALHELEGKGKILFASVYDKYNRNYYGDLISGVGNPGNKGAVNEEKVEDYFFKYRLAYEGTNVKSLPLLMFERINKDTVHRGILGTLRYHNKAGRRITAHNSFIPEMEISTDDIDRLPTPERNNEGRVNPDVGYMELWQAVKRGMGTDNVYLTQVLRPGTLGNRTIFIGAFSHDHSDMHKTLYGDMDGSLILLNIYHNLVSGANRVNVIYHILIFFSFLFLFRILFIKINWFNHLTLPRKIQVAEWFVKQLPYFILVAMTLIANIFFGQVTNVIVLIVLIGGIKLLKKVTNNWSGIKWKDSPWK